ncbi:MAG: alpha-galactosidase [Lentisphaeria bacterium]|nr:alpha-galactosidase [Lentisphaeria bacterium]
MTASTDLDACVRYRSGEEPGACYVSGAVVFDEALQNRRLVCRYWNANGQSWPEMHLRHVAWQQDQPTDTFQLAVNGRELAGGFTWTGADVMPDNSGYRPRLHDGETCPVCHSVLCLKHQESGMTVKVHTRLDGGPFIIRWLEIGNLTEKPVAITAVAPFAGPLWTHRCDEHLPPDCRSPFEIAYNHRFDWGQEGDFWFEPLLPGKLVVDGGRKGKSGWGRPAFWAKNLCNGQTFVCELAWSGNYAFELDCRLDAGAEPGDSESQRRHAEAYFRMGLSGHDEALRVVDPGESVLTPAVHLGLFHTNLDSIVQATHRHVRHVVMPEPITGREVEIEANHRGYLCDRENVPDIKQDVDVAREVGAEMYVIDAGWFGNEPNHWINNVGDWHDGAWLRRDGGLKAVADHVHLQGMKFGLWVEIEAAGASSVLKRQHPDWLLRRDGRPVADGRALDLTQPQVAKFAADEIERLICTYDLDMYRIDHNHSIQPSGNRQYQGFTEDLTWRYYDAFYAIFERLRDKFPAVVFQNCAGGGGRLDWGTMARFHNTEISDWMRLPRALKILNGVTMSLPPEILLRTFGTEAGEHTLDGDLDTQLRQCFCRPIFRGIAPSTDDLTPYLKERITHFLDLFREHIRPVMLDGLVFHHTPCVPVLGTTPWCVLEYAAADRSRAVAALFRTSAQPPTEYLFRPRGLDHSGSYEVRMDSGRQVFRAAGSALCSAGIPIRSESPLTSELLILSRLFPKCGEGGNMGELYPSAPLNLNTL